MKPIRKTSQRVDEYSTFATPELLADLLFVHWSAMNVIGDDDEVEINCELPLMIPVIIKMKKGKGVRARYRVLNGERKSI